MSAPPAPAPTTPVGAISPQMLHAMLDAIPARVVVIDRQHRFVYLNQEALDFVRRPASQLIGQPLAAVVGEAAYQAIYKPLHEQLFVQRQPARTEGWVDYQGGIRRYVQEHFLPFGPEGQEADSVFVFVRDLTGLKLREAELSAKVRELQVTETLKASIVDHATAALVTTQADGSIVDFNPAAEAMFGLPRPAVLGRNVAEVLIPERFREGHLQGMQRMRSGATPRLMGKRVEMSALRGDGSEFPIELLLWRTQVGAQVFYTASISDLTERLASREEIERQREALRQSEKLSAMGSLLAGVAHELNNPLAIVMGRASLLEDKCDDEALRQDAQRIREAAERCGRIVRTFLNMARQRPSQRVDTALNDLVIAATDMLAYALRSHGIELVLDLAGALPVVPADPDQIGQIVLNLIVNAQQALAGQPGLRRIRVSSGLEARRPDRPQRVWLRVHDSGRGVAEEVRARLFQSFFTTKAEGSGTGLGLAVSRSLARDHGGDLVLEETPQGQGACFRLSLPLGGEAGPPTLPAVLETEGGEGQGRVLVVDDEAEIADLMRAMLESAGYEVATAESGAIALEMLAEVRFDAVVSDLRMPDMDGAQLWRQVRERFPGLARRMLFVTGDTLSPSARRFLDEGRSPSLDKPFSRTDLLEQVRRLIDNGDPA